MILYHGSCCVVKKPDILHSASCLDFGKGFYVTSIKEQAERWARRRALLNNASYGYVSAFNFVENQEFNILDFIGDLDSWIDFVCACREGADLYKKYDIIKGYVADDKVFRVVDMYKRGIWDRDRAIHEIRVYPTFDQFAFVTQKAIDSMLTFIDGYKVDL